MGKTLKQQGEEIRHRLKTVPLLNKIDNLALQKKGRWTDFERKLYELSVRSIEGIK